MVKKLFPTGGVRAVQERFEKAGFWRSPDSIKRVACYNGIGFGQVPGYVRLSELMLDGWEGYRWYRRKAERDGVLLVCGYDKGARVLLVPEDWADEAAEEIGEALRVRDSAQWLTTKEAAKLFGVTPPALVRAMTGERHYLVLSPHATRIPVKKDTLKGNQPSWRWSRPETEEEARKYRTRRAWQRQTRGYALAAQSNRRAA